MFFQSSSFHLSQPNFVYTSQWPLFVCVCFFSGRSATSQTFGLHETGDIIPIVSKCTGCSFNIFLQLAYLRDSRSKLSKLPIQQSNVYMDGNMVLKTCSKPVQGGKPDRKPMKTSFWRSLVFNQTRLKDGWLLWCLWLLWLLRLLWFVVVVVVVAVVVVLVFVIVLVLLLVVVVDDNVNVNDNCHPHCTSENQPWWGLAESSYTISPLVWFLVPHGSTILPLLYYRWITPNYCFHVKLVFDYICS